MDIDEIYWHPLRRNIIQPTVRAVTPVTLRGPVVLESKVAPVGMFSALIHIVHP